jgi:predicted ATPase
MSKIKIKNFGPIKEGILSNDGWMNIPKITIFIGNQGSGKSSIAKVLSTLKWIEKALIQNKIKENDLSA